MVLLLRRTFVTPSSVRCFSSIPLLTPTSLSKLLSSPNPPKVLDSSWHMPNLVPPRSAWTEFKTKRIPGAAFWDVDIIATKNELGFPHMLSSAELFADACSRLGISRDDHVVVYDTAGVFSSPRAAFTFKAFGHPQISLLNGGLPSWISSDLPLSTSLPHLPNPHSTTPTEASPEYGPIMSILLYDKRPAIESYFIQDVEEHMPAYVGAKLDEGAVRSYEEMVGIVAGDGGDEVVVDARPAGRFHGTAPEPRASLSSGHMPHSFSLPSSTLLSTTSSYPTLLPPPELEKVFTEALGAEVWREVKDGKKKVVASCGSGMTACSIWLALDQLGVGGSGVYDESWTGYASRKDSVIVKS